MSNLKYTKNWEHGLGAWAGSMGWVHWLGAWAGSMGWEHGLGAWAECIDMMIDLCFSRNTH